MCSSDLMDMFMPVMDGMEAVEVIMELNTGTPIVAMTANMMAGDLEMYKKHGVHDCLGKPFTAQELWKCLMKYLPVTSTSAFDERRPALDDEKTQKYLKAIFVRRNNAICSEILEAAAGGDAKLAHRLAHTLKGSAAQIGEYRLADAAAAIEALFAELRVGWTEELRVGGTGGLISESLMVALESEMGAVLARLTPVLDEVEARSDAVPLDEEKVRELFEKLEVMLIHINPECISLLDDLRAIPGTEVLIRQIENFDFEAALETLSGFMFKGER